MLIAGVAGASTGYADGGHVSLHADSEAYSVTLFTRPVPLTTGPVELTLMVQPAEARRGVVADESLAGATASGVLQLAASAPVAFSFARASVTSPLLSTNVTLPSAGDYALRLTVSAPGQPGAVFHGTLPVEANHGRRTTVIVALLLPLAAILLFLLNQHAKARAYSRS